MADNYLTFSEGLDNLTPEQVDWFEKQLEEIAVVDGQEMPVEDLTAEQEKRIEWQGCRFLRDYEDEDDDYCHPGFDWELRPKGHKDEKQFLWLYAEESGSPARLAHLIQGFLRRFDLQGCWSITYAATCSKPRLSEFGGGAVFVTADAIEWMDTYSWVDDRIEAHEQRQQEHKKKG